MPIYSAASPPQWGVEHRIVDNTPACYPARRVPPKVVLFLHDAEYALISFQWLTILLNKPKAYQRKHRENDEIERAVGATITVRKGTTYEVTRT